MRRGRIDVQGGGSGAKEGKKEGDGVGEGVMEREEEWDGGMGRARKR